MILGNKSLSATFATKSSSKTNIVLIVVVTACMILSHLNSRWTSHLLNCKEPSTQVPGSNKPEMSLERIFRECTTRPYVFIPKKCYGAVHRNKLYHRRDNSMCKSHLNPVIVINSSRVYQNKHCLSEGTTHIECFNGEWPSSLPTTVPRGVDEIISLDSAGVPFIHQKVTSASNAPRQCVSLNILVIYIYGCLVSEKVFQSIYRQTINDWFDFFFIMATSIDTTYTTIVQ